MPKDSRRNFSDLIPDDVRDKPTIHRRVGEGIEIGHQAGLLEGYEQGRMEGLKEGHTEGYVKGIRKATSKERRVIALGCAVIGGFFGLGIAMFGMGIGLNDPGQLAAAAGIGCVCTASAASYFM
jgi:hypothetical protein